MSDAPRTFNGHLVTPKLTSDQEQIILQSLAQGSTQEEARKAAGCSMGRVREYIAKTANAKAIRELQISTSLLRLNQRQNELMDTMVAYMSALDSRITNTNGQIGKISKAVSRTKATLTRTKDELRNMKAENRKLRAYIHRTTGLDPDLV